MRDECTPEGTTGTWNAATGSSGGWQEWKIDLSAYHGQDVEIALVYATDSSRGRGDGMLAGMSLMALNIAPVSLLTQRERQMGLPVVSLVKVR